jgi:hypothetical protein
VQLEVRGGGGGRCRAAAFFASRNIALRA